MKSLSPMCIVLLAILSVTPACAHESGRHSYSAGNRVCLELVGETFGIKLTSQDGAREILGNGTFSASSDVKAIEYVDSFNNEVSGFFDLATGKLSLKILKKDIDSPSAVQATYGEYKLSESECLSNALP